MIHEYSDHKDYLTAANFFKSPNGTTLLEKGQFARFALFAIKLPLGDEGRFSAVMAQHLHTDLCEENAIFPDWHWQLALDSYVDNRTGTRILCQYPSEFEHILKYKEGIPLTHAIDEIEAAIQDQIAHMSDDALIAVGRTYGKHLEQNLTLSDSDIKAVHSDSEQAYVFNTKPDCFSNLLPPLNLSNLYCNGASARFAISYLRDKEQFILDLTETLVPKHAANVLRARAMVREAKRYTQQLNEHPPPELLKERYIRKAIEGKATVWATFGKEGKTLRLSVPTAMFYSSKDLNDYTLTEKDRHRLRDFLKDSNARHLCYPHISDVVSLDYKGRVLYKDEDFHNYRQPQTQNSPSLDELVTNACKRIQVQSATIQSVKEKTR